MGASIYTGQIYTCKRIISEEDVILFAKATGDTNPLHLDEEYAKTTMFGGRIAHGMLAGGVISGVLGMHFPGAGTTYLSQTLKFKKPVRIGDTITIQIEVAEIIPKAKYCICILNTSCINQSGELVVEGQASVIPPQNAEVIVE